MPSRMEYDQGHPPSPRDQSEMLAQLRERMMRSETILAEYRDNWNHIRNRMATQESARNNFDSALAEIRFQQANLTKAIAELKAMQMVTDAKPDVFQALTPWAKIVIGALATVVAFIAANPAMMRRLASAIFQP